LGDLAGQILGRGRGSQGQSPFCASLLSGDAARG
jgi:hypothetical protein